MKKTKIDPVQAKNLVKAWNESENGLNLFKVSKNSQKSLLDTPLFKPEDKQTNLFN
jgi:hypothetical protein